MNTSPDPRPLASRRALIVGVGGVGAPAALAHAEAGVGALVLADDDVVEASNLHRQILFSPSDVGRSKLEATRDALRARAPRTAVELRATRATPATVAALVRDAHVVIDATDNFATRFLLADACHLAGVAIVHAAAVAWRATVLAVRPRGAPCYRCLFEDLPAGPAPDCASAGIVGPVCGVAGAVAAEMALDLATGAERLAGHIATYDGRSDALRLVAAHARAACCLCGTNPSLVGLDEQRYLATHACGGDAA